MSLFARHAADISFSALKMDGKPLYEYARENKPLPRAIPVRECQVEIDLLDFTPAQVVEGDGGHTYKWPAERLDAEKKAVFKTLTQMVHDAGGEQATGEPEIDLSTPDFPEVSEKTGLRPATFTVRMTVSSGTYVRSIVHDIGLALGCGAHVVKLTRTRQGEFVLSEDDVARVDAKRAAEEPSTADAEEEEMNQLNAAATAAPSKAAAAKLADKPGRTTGCIPWAVFEKAIAEREERVAKDAAELEDARQSGVSPEEIDMQYGPEARRKRDHEGPLKEWEEEVLRTFHPVPVPVVRDSKTRAEGVYFRR